MDRKNYDEEIIRLLLARLERISSDSYWAHRASGIRGSLLKAISQYEQGGKLSISDLQPIITFGFLLLERAAKDSKGSDKKIHTHKQ